MIILWAWTAVLSGFLLFPLFVNQVDAISPIGAAALGVRLHLLPPGLRRGNGEDEEDEPRPGDSPRPRTGGPASEVVQFGSGAFGRHRAGVR